MAVVTTQNYGEAEVSSCVQNIILAFTDGLNVFKRLKERRKRKKNKHKGSGDVRDVTSEAESQLSNSLKRGPLELRDRYERGYGEKGQVFAKGDAIAHASLAETLIKLNTGLVRIIATFLNCNPKSSSFHLNYKSLISLSDASRREAVESLNQLHNRLSQSQLSLRRMAPSKSSEQTEKKRHAASRPRVNGPIVARASVKNSNQKQLVMVRPKNPRKNSTTSSSSSSSVKSPQLTAVGSSLSSPPPMDSPLGSPLPQYSPKDPFPLAVKAPAPKMSSGGKKKTASSNTKGPTMVVSPSKLDEVMPLPSTPPKKLSTNPSQPEKHTAPFPSQPITAAAVARRRLDKLTPSSYTFASDSTKLGEIPQRNWTTPWDYELAERLNAAAKEAGYYPGAPVQSGKQQKKKGSLFGFRRRAAAA
ncbi:hypothetical protein DM02DRAFT_667051 [Periconia macrospinosa]|uniref:Uncharacterized protein n=1 Tax=Periconia macrospinosa TaxID=97972 RepID=A0A2V1ECC4_9PLEO|nr:hypothetical protein DM02DRAFT_667051 [Periconia macrospinosa]